MCKVHLDSMALNGDATFAFQVHIVQHLVLHFLVAHSFGVLKQAVGKRALAVVDMCYYAEIPNIFHFLISF